MNAVLFEELLNEEESSTLDFKRDQYLFSGANDADKSELLKDILAFANSWRRTYAYILIGVDEVKGGRSDLIGIASQLNDNDLQQFVISKTNRPLIFSYEAFSFENKQFGIIKIPIQERPFYIKQRYGKLNANTVYIRRGSSTGIADLDEVAKMGASSFSVKEEIPELDLQFADIANLKAIGKSINIISKVVEYDKSVIDTLQQPSRPTNIFQYQIEPLHSREREEYKKEMAKYIADMSILTRIGFCLNNTSSTAAVNTKLRIEVHRQQGLVLKDMNNLPKKPPRTALDGLGNVSLRDVLEGNKKDIKITNHNNTKIIQVDFGTIQPKATIWTNSVFLIGASNLCDLNFDALIFADNLPEPIKITLPIKIDVEMIELDYRKLM